MTNASIKNLLFGISVLTVAATISLGVFATVAHAQDDFEAYGGDVTNVADTGVWGDFQPYNDFEAYPTNDFQPYTNDFEPYNNDFQPYANDFQPYANDFQPYANDFQPYANDFQPYNNDLQAYDSGCDCYETVTDTTYETSQGYSYSSGGSAATYHSTPMTIVPPSYPVYPSYPVQPPVRPQPTPVSNTTVTTNTNTCTNNSCNTSYTDNSINGSFNTAPVYPVTPQPIVQYVYPQNYTYPTYTQAPFCSITIGQGYQTGMTFLSWSSTGATSAYISPNVGTVNVNGSTNIYSYGNTVYTLTVTGPGGTYTCRTQSYIAPIAPIAPYVSLSQIPYTGFDFGTFGNALYWMGLLAFAAAGAYLVVYYQGGALALAGNMLGGRTVSYSETTTETVPVPAHTEVEVAHEVAHEAPVALFNLPTMSASSTKDSMTVAHTADGIPRIVITRN